MFGSPTVATQYVANLGSVKKSFSISNISLMSSGLSRFWSADLDSYMKWISCEDCRTERSARRVYRLVLSCAWERAYERLTTSSSPRSQS